MGSVVYQNWLSVQCSMYSPNGNFCVAEFLPATVNQGEVYEEVPSFDSKESSSSCGSKHPSLQL